MSIIHHIYDKFTITNETVLPKEQNNIHQYILRVLLDYDINCDNLMKSMNVNTKRRIFLISIGNI